MESDYMIINFFDDSDVSKAFAPAYEKFAQSAVE